MAKLENVKVIDMVGGEVTKISFEGAEYAKVDDVAKVGDIAYLISGGYVFISKNAYYYVYDIDFEGDPVVLDNDNDKYELDTSETFRIFRKISAPTIEERVSELERKVDAIVVKEKTKTSEPTYRLVSGRDARVGDFVKFNRDDRDITSGKYYEVIRISGNGDVVFMDDENDTRFRCPKSRYLEIYEKVTEAPAESAEPEPLKVGDYAKVIQENHDQYGEICEIISDTYSYRYPYDTKDLNGNVRDCFKREHLVKATDEEVAEAKAEIERQQAEAKETERWAKIGREVNEYKVGDIVRVESPGSSRLIAGEFGEVTSVSTNGSAVRIGGRLNLVNNRDVSGITLITPVEARFDRE